jgi:uncharacterized membrane protein YdjX (TVP38/TMEM64 family)
MRSGSRRKRKTAAVRFKGRTWLGLFLLILIIAGSTLVLYKTGLVAFFLNTERMAHFLDSLGPLSFVGFIILQVLQVIISPIPGEVTGFIGGFLYGKFLGTILSTLGLTIGSWAAFSLSRFFGRPFAEKFIEKKTMERYDYLLHHKGAFLIFLLFLIPGFPKDYLCYILGLGHLSTKEFLIISTVGRFMGTLLLTLGGDFIRHEQYYRLFLLLSFAIVILFLSMVYREKIERFFQKLQTGGPDEFK